MRSMWHGPARWMAVGLMAALAVLAFTFIGQAQNQIAQIPGITAEDARPNGCIDCHQPGGSHSLSHEIASLAEDGHPNVPSDDPASCMRCHSSTGRLPMGRLMHVAHLTGGADNHFISRYDGECMHCHTMSDDGSIGVKGL